MFGRPSRISARAWPGRGRVLDIEREVALGGPLHSKGVLILTGFLGDRYGRSRPLALSASLVFEQSYSGVDGDSATLAETAALLSAIAGVPLRQDVAVTGSLDQLGNVQAVGGVNEKIEGFFRLCAARGLSGTQGVVLPAANVRTLQLADDVVDAVGRGLFHIWPARTVDEALGLLTGMEPGHRDGDGAWIPGTFNAAVDHRLGELAATVRRFAREDGEEAER
jgi:predicted ATP-dependent protease